MMPLEGSAEKRFFPTGMKEVSESKRLELDRLALEVERGEHDEQRTGGT
jgi:hypothetical protein